MATDQDIGLSRIHLTQILAIISRYSEIESVTLFGSRAMNNHKPGSDVDIAVTGINCEASTVFNLTIDLNERSSLPYRFDIVDLKSIAGTPLERHIKESGILLK